MKTMHLYLETTMFDYYFDVEREYHPETVRLFEEILRGTYVSYTSEYAVIELSNAPEPKRSKMLSLVGSFGINMLAFDEEAERLADLYVVHGVIPAKYRMDATHIAVAAIHGLDCVLSFNFEHINKLRTKRMTELINLGAGYKGIMICTPMEVLEHDSE